MGKIKALVFDLGMVVLDQSYENVFEAWSRFADTPPHVLKERFIFDNVLEKFERNEISSDEFRNLIRTRLEISLSDYDFDQGWCTFYTNVYEGVNELLSQLKGSYRTVALMNTNILHSRVCKVKYADTLRHYERVFCSHEIGSRKPEEKCFKRVIDYLQYPPDEIAFFDDEIKNVNAAAVLGMQSVLIANPKSIMQEIRKLELIAK